MAQMFLSESSRRNQGISESEMEDRWQKAFGERKQQTCSMCGKPAHETKDGLCTACQYESHNFDLDKMTCVQCGNAALRLNDLGLCFNCQAINSMEGTDKYHGE